MRPMKRVALVYGAPAGVGGLEGQAATAIQALAIEGVELHAFGTRTRRAMVSAWSMPKDLLARRVRSWSVG